MPQVQAFTIICGTSRKRKIEEPSAGTPTKKAKSPIGGHRPIIEMVLHIGPRKNKVKVLLDTGCSISLINQETAR